MDIYFGTAADRHYERWPLTLVDVGARGGLQPNWRPATRHLRVVAFEPDPAEHARLARQAASRAIYINAAAGREQGRATLNIGRDPGTSSLLEPETAFLQRFPRADRFDVVKRVEIGTDRLDALLPAHGIDDCDFLKIDTQGAELHVLEGSRELLARAIFGVELEVQFAPLYRGQPSFGALDDFLRERGFQLFDLRPSYWKRTSGAFYGGPKGQLVFGDALYLKREDAFQEQLAGMRDDAPARAAKLLRALSICALYGYADYGIALIDAHRDLLDPAIGAAVDAQLRGRIALWARLPHFRGRGWLSHLFYRVHRTLYPTVDRWASGGRTIGNVD